MKASDDPAGMTDAELDKAERQRTDLGDSYRRLAGKDSSAIRAAAYLELAQLYEAGAKACREERARRAQ